jgi:o-succinylbenzoate synthase
VAPLDLAAVPVVSRGPLRARIVRFLLPAGTGRGTAKPTEGSANGRFGILLELRDADGRRGWGEASPLPGYAAETPGHAAAVLLTWLADAGTARAMELDIDSWPAAFGDFGLANSPAARAAIVSALLDLAGRRGGVPIRDLLGAESPVDPYSFDAPAGLPADGSVPLNALVALDEVETAVQSAVEASRRGIRTIKAKLGAGQRFDTDLVTLRAVRNAVGPSISIRLDVNGRWSLPEARRNLDRLTELEPEYVEEPVSGAELVELVGSAVPLAADESLHDPDVATRLLDSDAVSVLVLKPSPLGGLDRCVELAARATAAGKRSVVTHSFEGPVGHGAACELGLAIAAANAGPFGNRLMAFGLDRHAALEAWSDVTVPQLRDSSLVPADVSGHGIDPTPLLERSGADGSI